MGFCPPARASPILPALGRLEAELRPACLGGIDARLATTTEANSADYLVAMRPKLGTGIDGKIEPAAISKVSLLCHFGE